MFNALIFSTMLVIGALFAAKAVTADDLPTQTAVLMVGVSGMKGTFQCSGMVIAEGVVLTAKHCLEAAKHVRRGEQWYEVTGGKIHQTQDAAIVYVRGIQCPCAPVADAIEFSLGAPVRAVGFPSSKWSDERGEVLSVTTFGEIEPGETLLAHTAFTWFGASGGGLWQEQGPGNWKLIGVHSRIQFMGFYVISHAVPVVEIRELLEE